MTSASQFTGGHQIAIGESITLNHSLNQVTIDGQVFLRAGVLDTVAGYETSIATNPGIGVIISNTGVYTNTVGASTTIRPIVVGAGTTTFLVTSTSGDSIFYKNTDLNSAISSNTNLYTNYGVSNVYDAVAVPSTTPYVFVPCYYANGGSYGVFALNAASPTGPTWYGTTSSYPMYALASKPDGSLVIGVGRYDISSSANLFKWVPNTASNPLGTITGGTISTVRWLTWSISASKFIAIGNTGDYGTSADGLAWTKLGTTITGLPGGIDVGNTSTWGQSTLCANSTTATVILVRNSSSPFNWYIIRTTDGVTFTVTSFASLNLYVGATVDAIASTATNNTRITSINNVFYIYRDNSTNSIVTPCIYSSTDGITWNPVVPIVIYNMSSGTSPISFLGNISSSANTFVLSQTTSTSGTFTTLPTMTATHVGRLDSLLNQYVRVK